jgi:hypothetical protein
MAGYITMTRALQVNMVVSALFTVPFFALGAHQFAELLVDGTVKASTFASGPTSPMFTHLLWVDAVKNIFLTGLCYVAQSFPAKAQKQVAYLFMGMWALLLPLFFGVYGSPPIKNSTQIPPPVIAYLAITGVAYALAMVEKSKKKKKAASKKK